MQATNCVLVGVYYQVVVVVVGVGFCGECFRGYEGSSVTNGDNGGKQWNPMMGAK